MCDSRRPSEGADSESVPRGNRPAPPWEWRDKLIEHAPAPMVDAALRSERLAAVEEIASRLPAGFEAEYDGIVSAVVWRHDLTMILDEVGVAARSAQSDSAGLTEERDDG